MATTIVLTGEQASRAIRYNNHHATDLLPALKHRFGLAAEEASRLYTTALVQKVAAFQERFGLVIDGMIGRHTRRVMEEELFCVDASPLWPPEGASRDAKFRHYASIHEYFGHLVQPDRATLLGLRGVRLFAHRTHVVQCRAEFDDTFILLGPEEQVHEFRGSTHPYLTRTTKAPDVNRDGVADVGMIRPGMYQLKARPGLYKGYPALFVLRASGSNRLPAYRDLNQDGYFSEEEMEAAEAAVTGPQVTPGVGAWADGILFHPGPEKGFSSLGCQNASLEFVQMLHRMEQVHYLLLNAVDVLACWKPPA